MNRTLTITNPIQGQEYAVYKIMELESFSGDNYSYKVANEWKEFFDSGEGKNYVTIDKNEYVHWNGDESKVAEFAKSALEYANNHKDKINPIKNGENGVTVVEGTNADSTKNITYNNLSLGYYLVGSSTGALCSLDTTKPSATIKEKNEKPTVVKKINNESGLVSKDSAFIGDQVVYEINITAGVGAKNYVLHDKMDAGLELVNGGIQIFDNKGSGHLTTSDYTVIVFVTGLSLLLYPTVSNYWNSLHQTKAVANYSDAMEKMSRKKKQDAIDAAKAYNEALLSNAGRFTPTEEELDTYKSLLNADGTGMMGYIEIPEIRCELAIYHTVDESVLQVGIGHLEGSSLPVGGSGTHCVLSGHRGLPSAQLFTKLDRLKKGDIFTLHVYDQVLTYEVDQIAIVEPEDYGLLQIEEGQDLCTLFTCTPYGINTHRLLVRGHRIENRAGSDVRVTSDAAKVSSVLVAVCIAIPLLIISFLVADRSAGRSKKKNKK